MKHINRSKTTRYFIIMTGYMTVIRFDGFGCKSIGRDGKGDEEGKPMQLNVNSSLKAVV